MTKTMFMLIEWVRDPPTWDVLPVKKVIYGEIEVGNVCDVEYLEESSPARIIELGSRNTLLKALGKLERDRAGGPTTTSGPSGRGQREKRPPAPYSPGGTTSDNDECVPMKRKKKERESSSKKILMEYYAGLGKSSGDSDSATINSMSHQLDEIYNILIDMNHRISRLEKHIITNHKTPMPAGASVPPTVQHPLAAPTTPVHQPAPPAPVRQPGPPTPVRQPAPPPPSASATTICSTNNTDVHIGLSTSITQHQYGSIKWFNAKKATKDLLLAVFGRSILASHSYTGKQSNAFRTKAAKPQLNPVKVGDIINYITKRFGVDQGEVKKAISEKCADQEKMEKRWTH
ncbi:uncharacterized protein LOC125307282 isoform X2 [Alosa alosa]|uniref:uncharacterized protein LOC125307282 isoform X2 n=1 Tax=Alosa alosa TaxID=278164 RepID=UPI0020154CD4|nr:uncharacterized protein LOC125307282 isoform X2 [Alosa alosa]